MTGDAQGLDGSMMLSLCIFLLICSAFSFFVVIVEWVGHRPYIFCKSLFLFFLSYWRPSGRHLDIFSSTPLFIIYGFRSNSSNWYGNFWISTLTSCTEGRCNCSFPSWIVRPLRIMSKSYSCRMPVPIISLSSISATKTSN